MPASTSTSTSSSSRAAAVGPYAKPAPRPRRTPSSTLDADPALGTLGALYIGWGAGQQDPAPLCCAVQARASLVHRFGEAAVGYLTVQPQAQPLPKPRPRQPPPSASLACLPLGALPPLPPLPRRTSSTSSSLSTTPSLSATSSLSSSPGLTPSPPTPPPSELFTFEDALNSSVKDAFGASTFDDTTLALPLVDSRPSSPRLGAAAAAASSLAAPALPPLPLHSGTTFVPTFSLSLASVPEYVAGGVSSAKDEVVDEDDEALWSAGEDPLWNCGATDVMSEASWAW
ncbi:hypothetical protein JCM3775_003345 [Rhodotorula graminis]